MNALKHGNRSKKVELFREESYSFENRLRKWMTIGDAQNDVEEYLVYRNVSLSFDLDRADRARLQRYEDLIENADEIALTNIHELGARLFFDPCGATPLYGNPQSFNQTKKTSWNHEAINPNDPALLVRNLERSEAGCRFLRDRWHELRRQLEPPNFFQSHDRFKAIRLLGREPVQAIEDRRVCEIFVASHGLNPVRKNEFDDLLSDLDDEQRVRYRKALVARWPDLFRAREEAEWRQILLDLVDRNIELLNARLEAHEENADVVAEKTFALLSFDPSPEGAALRSHQMKCLNALFRGMDNYRKHKNRSKDGGSRAGGPRRDLTGLDNSDRRTSEAQEGDGSQFGVHERDGSRLGVPEGDGSQFGVNDEVGLAVGQHERLEWAVDASGTEPGCGVTGTNGDRPNTSDADRAEEHEDDMSRQGEIDDNATSEANFDETRSFTEIQDPVQVTSNPEALPGLDNGFALPAEVREQEATRDQESRSDRGNPWSQEPLSGDPAGTVRSLSPVSEREMQRMQREKSGPKAELMLANELKAGTISLCDIIDMAALPP